MFIPLLSDVHCPLIFCLKTKSSIKSKYKPANSQKIKKWNIDYASIFVNNLDISKFNDVLERLLHTNGRYLA